MMAESLETEELPEQLELEQLPVEVRREVLRWLGRKELAAVVLVSRSFRSLGEEVHLWAKLRFKVHSPPTM